MLEVQIGLIAVAWVVAEVVELSFGLSEVVTTAVQVAVVDSGRAEPVAVGRVGWVALEVEFVGYWLVAVVDALGLDAFGVAVAAAAAAG